MTPPVWSEYPPFKQFGGFKGGIPRGRFFYVLGKSNAANSEETTESTTGFVSLLATEGVGWHKVMTLPVVTPTVYNVWLDPTNDYLYLFAYDSSLNGTLWKIRLQTYSDLAYVNYPTTGAHYFYTSYYHFGMERIYKHFASLTLHGELAANQKVAVSYRTDTSTSWTALATDFTADLQEIEFPSTVTGKRIQFRFNLTTTSATSTPIVKALVLKVMFRPDVKWGCRCDIILGDSLHDQRGLALGKSGATILTALEGARSSVAPFTMVDLFGVSRTAYLASMSVEPLAYEDSNSIESVARCTFMFD